MATVQVVLSFDDGPASPRTQAVISTLAANPVQPSIVGAFFIQTHVPTCMGSPSGVAAVQAAHQAQHLIGIHTGSDADHVLHTVRVAEPAYAGGQNALESDMIRAKARITQATGNTPDFVRAVEGNLGTGATRTAILATYGRVNLKHVLWDIDSTDSAIGATADSVRHELTARTKAKVQAGKRTLIVLLHDRGPLTSLPATLITYLQAIQAGVVAAGHNAAFVTTRTAVVAAFNT